MTGSIVYFDGQCNLCDGFARFVLARDRRRRFRFAPLQGTTARSRLPSDLTAASMRTIVLEEIGGREGPEARRVRVRSDAVVAILSELGGLWRLIAILRIIPRPVRDLVYDYVARKRFRWFGRMENCRIPTAEERERFLP